MPVDRMLRSADRTELDMWEQVRLEAVKVLDDLMTTLARKFVKEQSDAQTRGKGKSGG